MGLGVSAWWRGGVAAAVAAVTVVVAVTTAVVAAGAAVVVGLSLIPLCRCTPTYLFTPRGAHHLYITSYELSSMSQSSTRIIYHQRSHHES